MLQLTAVPFLSMPMASSCCSSCSFPCLQFPLVIVLYCVQDLCRVVQLVLLVLGGELEVFVAAMGVCAQNVLCGAPVSFE